MAPKGLDEVITIKVTKRTRERLERSARRNETTDELINRLIDEHKKRKEDELACVRETWEDIHE